MSKKTVLALLSVDEDLLSKEGRESEGFIKYFESEISMLEDSGITLKQHKVVEDNCNLDAMHADYSPAIEEIDYYWYHHGIIPAAEKEKITKCIYNHDFESFCKFREKWNDVGKGYDWYNQVFLPGTAFDPDARRNIDITVPEGFNRITYTECECG